MSLFWKVLKVLRLLLAVGQVIAPFVKDPGLLDIRFGDKEAT